MVVRHLALALALSGCAAGPWSTHAGMGWRWPAEPSVGVSMPELREPTRRAVAAWQYGRFRSTCVDVDVCVVVGTAHHAGPHGSRCIAEIALGHDALGVPAFSQRVIEHEVGHCYGLAHSTDPTSVMCSNGDKRTDVQCAPRIGPTAADRRLLFGPGAE